MKLRVRFLQLPIVFDADQLAKEVAGIPESAWRPHPKNFPGNDALPLITTDGDPASDARAGPMAPTPHLLACPYLMQVLETLGATWGRARLMRLSGDAEVTAHVDTDYYWRDRMRVHVPIVTQPTVRFLCGGEDVNMKSGECWIFDTWSLHSVHNDATRARIHLVADTVGGDGLLSLIERGRSPRDPRPDWSPSLAPLQSRAAPRLAFEHYNLPDIMTPWELRDHLGFLMSEVSPGNPNIAPVGQTLNRLRANWHALWAQSGADLAARPAYSALLTEAWLRLETQGVHDIVLNNQMSLSLCLKALIFNTALSGAGALMDGDERINPAQTARGPLAAPPPPHPVHPVVAVQGRQKTGAQGRDPRFDRPVFIVSSPRSGSSLLFETLSTSVDIHTVGGESHGVMEAVPQINPANRGWDSNRLTDTDANPAVKNALRERFDMALRDRLGQRPGAGPVRMLEKTPKNALRIPFLAEVFPEARFIYLHRDPRATLASMIEAWSSGKYRTYPHLPGWTGLSWSLLLTPNWRDLAGLPLSELVAHQWAVTTRIMLDDLTALPEHRWRPIRYETFVASPQSETLRLCEAMDLFCDRPPTANLPLARNTLSPPHAQKWRTHEEAIITALPVVSAQNARAEAILAAANIT